MAGSMEEISWPHFLAYSFWPTRSLILHLYTDTDLHQAYTIIIIVKFQSKEQKVH